MKVTEDTVFDSETPWIIGVAFRFIDGSVDGLSAPNRHNDLMIKYRWKPDPHTKGFILSDGKFVNRRQAHSIAVYQKQLLSDAYLREYELTSVMVW